MFLLDGQERRALGRKDFYEAVQLGECFGECRKVDEIRDLALTEFAKSLDCERGNFFITHCLSGGVNLRDCQSRGMDLVYRQQYVDHYHPQDPFLSGFPFDHAVVTDQDLFSDDFVNKSEYFNDFLRPQAVLRELFISLKTPRTTIGFLSFFRSTRAKPFTPRERAKASLVARPLSRALEGAILAESHRKMALIMKLLGDQIKDRGLMFLDESLEPILLNDVAQNIFLHQTASGRAEDSDRLLDYIRRECRELSRSPAGPQHDQPVCRELVPDESSAGLTINLGRLSPATSSPFLVTLCTDDLATRIGHRLNRLGVTRREAEVVQLICEGLTNRQIADRLCISLNTVESHLRSVYQKLGVPNRGSLISTLLTPSG
jgi:DNA-binding CsgD family transcriptional regulator